MEIKRVGSQPSQKGPSDWFTGSVRIDMLIQAPDPALVAGASVTFEPGARTAWHTHPLGQTLIVTAGCGWAQREGGAVKQRQERGRTEATCTGQMRLRRCLTATTERATRRWESRRHGSRRLLVGRAPLDADRHSECWF